MELLIWEVIVNFTDIGGLLISEVIVSFTDIGGIVNMRGDC